jgi:ABC-type uncharacterized transport system fused permease/ATPase subunit
MANDPTQSPAQDAVDGIKHLANLAEFIDAVDAMRTAQKSFFKLRKSGTQKEISEWLAESKRLEKLCDDYLAKFRERKTAQTKLF